MAIPARPDDLGLRWRFDWLQTAVQIPADRGVLIAAAVAAVMSDVAVRAGGIGLAGALLVAIMVASILASGRVTGSQARTVVALAGLFGVWLLVRTSPWLLIPDVVVAASLIAFGVTLGRRSVFDVTIPSAAARGLQVIGHGVAGPAYVAEAVRSLGWSTGRHRRSQLRSIASGALMAAPLVALLALLLASADTLFASLFRLDLDPPKLVFHLIALIAGGWVMGGLLRASSGTPIGRLPSGPHVGAVEVMVVLGCMNALFLTFAVTQLVALAGGGRRVIETAGLTYAQYARRGFFQLLAVAAITLAAILVLRAVIDRRDPRTGRAFLWLAEVTVVLTLVIVVVAVRRLGLYADVFGLTMLRLYCTVFAYWIGVVFVLLGLALAGTGRGRSWWPAAAIGVGMAGLLWLNVVNPEALVVRHNVAFADRTGRFDPAYLSALSDDAVPTLTRLLPDLDPEAQALVLGGVCPPRPVHRMGWASFNLARDQATRSLALACGGDLTP